MNPISRTANHLAALEERRRNLNGLLGEVFPRATAFVWEIGCGHGHFLTAYAQTFPERVCLGIDITTDRIARAKRKSTRAQLANIHFIHAEARLFLEQLPPTATIQDVFILFPDPWPKKRHHKHRVVQSDFLSAMARKAEQGARIFFRTDYTPYFEVVRKTFLTHAGWELVDEPWPFERETVFQGRAATFSSLIAKRRASAP